MHGVEFSILLHRALDARLREFSAACEGKGGFREVEVVHRGRVAARRLRTVMGLLDPKAYSALKHRLRSLKQFSKELGLLRDLDVQSAGLQTLQGGPAEAGQQAAIEHLLEGLARRRRKRLARLDPKAPGLEKLLQVESLSRPFDGLPLPGAAWAVLAPLIIKALGPLQALRNTEDAPALHVARVGVKRLRDTLEALAPAFPTEPAGFLSELKALQKTLGDHHDSASLEALLWEHHGRLTEAGRPALATALLELLGTVAEARLQAFQAFAAMEDPFDPAEFSARLQALLGVAPA